VIVGDVTGVLDATVTILGAIITAVGIVFVVLTSRWRRRDHEEATTGGSGSRRERDERNTRQQLRAGLSLGVGLIVAGSFLVLIGLAL
jgi:hypothetical protein